MKGVAVLVAQALLLLLGPRSGEGSAPVRADSLAGAGEAHLERGRHPEARAAFKRALAQDSASVRAMAGLGAVAYTLRDWSKGKSWYGRVLDRVPDDPTALYRRAVCCRELGQHRPPGLRQLNWRSSRKLFERLLARDPLYKDGAYQYAILKRIQRRYREAIALAHRQVDLRPELADPQIGLFRLYTCYLDNVSTEDARTWLSGQATSHAECFLGDALRRGGHLQEADSVLTGWIQAQQPASRVPALLSLARVHYSQDDPLSGEAYHWRAVASIRDTVDAALVFEDTKYILSSEELDSYRGLGSAAAYPSFFRKVWTRRHPTPAADLNPRITAHYRRLHRAEADHVYDGLRGWFNNPDKTRSLRFPRVYHLNDRFNDKGLVYIRHGAPHDRARPIAQGLQHNDSWFYGKTAAGPEMVFHFAIDDNATGNNWRLTPHPPTLAGRETWGRAYHPDSRSRNPLHRLSREAEWTQKSREAVAVGLETDRHTWDSQVEPLDVPSHLGYFRAPGGTTRIELFFALPVPGPRALRRAGEGGVAYDWGLALHDLDWNRLLASTARIALRGEDPNRYGEAWIHQLEAAVPPDTCYAAFFVASPDGRRLGGWRGGIRVRDFSGDSLAVSSIVPAYAAGPAQGESPFTRGGLKVVPNPSAEYDRDDPVHIFFEVYNLTRDAYGATRYVVEYAVSRPSRRGVRQLLSLLGSDPDPATSVSVESRGDQSDTMEYLALDLSRAGRGRVRLSVSVSDRHTGARSTSYVDLDLR